MCHNAGHSNKQFATCSIYTQYQFIRYGIQETLVKFRAIRKKNIFEKEMSTQSLTRAGLL